MKTSIFLPGFFNEYFYFHSKDSLKNNFFKLFSTGKNI